MQNQETNDRNISHKSLCESDNSGTGVIFREKNAYTINGTIISV